MVGGIFECNKVTVKMRVRRLENVLWIVALSELF